MSPKSKSFGTVCTNTQKVAREPWAVCDVFSSPTHLRIHLYLPAVFLNDISSTLHAQMAPNLKHSCATMFVSTVCFNHGCYSWDGCWIPSSMNPMRESIQVYKNVTRSDEFHKKNYKFFPGVIWFFFSQNGHEQVYKQDLHLYWFWGPGKGDWVNSWALWFIYTSNIPLNWLFLN